jgi:hypothetical protein
VPGELRRNGKCGNFSPEPGDSTAYSSDHSEHFPQRGHILAVLGEKIAADSAKWIPSVAKGRPHVGETSQNSGSPPDLPRSTAAKTG